MRVSVVNVIQTLLYLGILYLILEQMYYRLIYYHESKEKTPLRKLYMNEQESKKWNRNSKINVNNPQLHETTTHPFTTVAQYENEEYLEQNKNTLAWNELKSVKYFMLTDKYARANFVQMPNLAQIEFLPNYKNPCWYEKKQPDERIAKLRCLPYFYIAGVEKCGTTDLFFSLITHDHIARGDIKETHYWSKGRFRQKGFLPKYLRFFSRATFKILMDMKRTSSGELYHKSVTLDASADTFIQNYAWKKFGSELTDDSKARNILTPFQIQHIIPTSKFVVILRDPVERLYSSYNYFALLSRTPGTFNQSRSERHENSFLKKSPEDFHAKVTEAITWFYNCTKAFPGSPTCFFWNEGEAEIDNFINHLQMGFYGPTLLTWLKAFPLKSFKFVKLEEYSKNKIVILNEILDFLDLPQVSPVMKLRLNQTGIRNAGQQKEQHGPMLEKTRKMLTQFYQPFNEILAKLLQDNRFLYSH